MLLSSVEILSVEQRTLTFAKENILMEKTMDFDYLRINYLQIQEEIALAAEKSGRKIDNIVLIAVTKTQPTALLQAVINTGIEHIGENKVQEITEKVPHLQGQKTVHMIGHLQRNKSKKAVQYSDWIHSMDSRRIIEAVNRHASDLGKTIHALVEVNTSGDISKNGCSAEEARELSEMIARASNLEYNGLMTIGPLHGNERETRDAFISLREIGETCKDLSPEFHLSMGMSSDFTWAIEEGATMIRIGTRLVGQRNYKQ